MAAKMGFNSRSLDYLAKVLGVGKKIDTGFGLWKKVVLDRNESALREMVRYNKHDVFPLLEGVYDQLSKISKPQSHVGVMNGNDKWTCPKDGSENVHVSKSKVTAAGTKQYQMNCRDCGAYYTISQRSQQDYAKEKAKK